jgi:hypothetical protein
MSVRGTIAVDVAFTDSTTSAGGSSLNTITLRDATEYTTGKVAIVTGTAGTVTSDVIITPTAYKDSAGNAVNFASAKRFAFSATGSPCRCQQDHVTVESSDGLVCVSLANGFDDGFVVFTTAGTASYTLVIHGT